MSIVNVHNKKCIIWFQIFLRWNEAGHDVISHLEQFTFMFHLVAAFFKGKSDSEEL